MSGIGSFDQTGSISSGLKRGLLTYGGGQAARYLGGAGFQEGYKPFAGADFSGGIMSGVKSLGTSPIGTDTGIGKMFANKAASIGQAQNVANLVPPGAGDPAQFLTEGAMASFEQLPTPTTYSGLLKQVVSPEATLGQRTEAIKKLGGKALKNIYTDDKGKIDKLAVASTIAGASSYLDAKRLAKEADLVGDENEYTKEMYEADKARYTEKYAEILPASAFGLKKGGRVGYQEGGTDTVINADDLDLFQEGSPKYYSPEGEEISFQEFEEAMKEPIMPRRKPEEMVERNKLEKLLRLRDNMEPEAFEMYLEKLKEESGDSGIPSIMLKKKMAIGGRVGFFEGTDDPQGRRKGIVSINPMQEDLEEVGIGTMAASPFTAAEKTFLFKFLAGKGGKERSITMPDLYKIFKNPGKYPKDEQVLKGVIEMKMGKKEGGRIGYKDAGSVLKGQRRDPYEIIAGMDNELNPGLLDKIPFFGAGKYPLDEDQGASLIKEIQDYKYGESYPNETIGVMEKGVFNVIPKPDRLPMSMEQTISTMEAEWDKAIEEGHRPGRGGKFDDLGIYSKEDIRRRVELGFDQARGPEIQKRNMRAANGGRIGFMMGSEVPVRENQAGVREMDFRNTGGFVPPIGVKEKADDIPAMLSNNEFVFTADAVRAAGGGSVNKGAQKMYALMKQLEGKLV